MVVDILMILAGECIHVCYSRLEMGMQFAYLVIGSLSAHSRGWMAGRGGFMILHRDGFRHAGHCFLKAFISADRLNDHIKQKILAS
jgi:hypothetical protein